MIVLPVLIVPLALMGFAASLSARNGITQIAIDFLKFKADSLENYAVSQWNLLEDNNLTESREFVDAAEEAVKSFALSLIRSETELIFAVDSEGVVQAASRSMETGSDELPALIELHRGQTPGWVTFSIENTVRVAHGFYFKPFDWYFLISESRSVFYGSVFQIYYQSGMILFIAAIVSIILLGFFISYLTSPLSKIVAVMREVISKNDLSKRVSLLYKDEIGELGHTFNLMSGELEQAYNQVKNYAYKAVIAEKQEKKIRNIFQKYVPQEVINEFFNAPETMLRGDSRVLAVLFSDIRGFTTISERLLPETVVESLNRYFGIMVDIIMKHKGIVDKYMGDAIMAFFGAPVRHENDSLLAVRSGLEMIEALDGFNLWQAEHERPPFRIGIGANYGVVTVGNIGSERKMDYTVIGDMVNTASRLESLTKVYKKAFVISESVYQRIKADFPTQQLDIVAVKGRSQGLKIYSVEKPVDAKKEEGWALYHDGLKLYYDWDFTGALSSFQKSLQVLPDDTIIRMYLERCHGFLKTPPPDGWNGITVMEQK